MTRACSLKLDKAPTLILAQEYPLQLSASREAHAPALAGSASFSIISYALNKASEPRFEHKCREEKGTQTRISTGTNALPTDNETIPSNAPVEVRCPTMFQGFAQNAVISTAVADARYIAHKSLRAVGVGMEGRAYAAMFKSHTTDHVVVNTFAQAASFPLYMGRQFLIACINTPEDGEQYHDIVPNLYQAVQHNPTVFNRNPRPTIFVGTKVFLRPSEGTLPRANLCPDISAHAFTENAEGRSFPITMANILFAAATSLYANTGLERRPGRLIELCNAALPKSADASATDFANYYCFAICTYLYVLISVDGTSS
ncbi:uncharacterized protein KY384_008585 [Bacidia gigantensis]|uniref:uncharacterized protein n=1 Tax=Bacidia gigantensis TaxID=2732470 RepID=UPI001D05233F|nr:uncharacterized protein KY384_008585 [Bacidia gigantensis]KAG8527155.1 hypothetical protein KY384_008585 [Bacidia gigantensis]